MGYHSCKATLLAELDSFFYAHSDWLNTSFYGWVQWFIFVRRFFHHCYIMLTLFVMYHLWQKCGIWCGHIVLDLVAVWCKVLTKYDMSYWLKWNLFFWTSSNWLFRWLHRPSSSQYFWRGLLRCSICIKCPPSPFSAFVFMPVGKSYLQNCPSLKKSWDHILIKSDLWQPLFGSNKLDPAIPVPVAAYVTE